MHYAPTRKDCRNSRDVFVKLSSASLRERWGRQLEPAPPESTQDSNTPVGVIPPNIPLAEQWSKSPKLANSAAVPAEEFPDIAEALSKGTIPKIELWIEHEMNDLVDITKETELMKEIKDILDELNIISSIFKQQLKIVKAMEDNQSNGKNPGDLYSDQPDSSGKGKGHEIPKKQDNLQDDARHTAGKYAELHQTLKGREQDIEDLKTEGTRVYKAVSSGTPSHGKVMKTNGSRYAICWVSSKNRPVFLKPTQRARKPKSLPDKEAQYLCLQ
jgi:hypothetical protein